MKPGSTTRAIVETALAISPWLPAPKPHSADGVDARWLSQQFAGRAPGAVAEALVPLDGTTGTTDRRRLGIEWNDAGIAAGLPSSLFVKSTPLSAKNRTMVAALDMAINEVRFYQQLRPELGDDVAPAVYASHAGHGARHLLVLEDLVASGARFLAKPDEVDLAYAQGMMRALGKLHAAFWESPRLAADLSWIAPESRRPGFKLLLWQFRSMRKKLLSSDEHDLNPAVRRMATFVNEHDRALHARWERGPQTVLHGDAHAGNSYSLPDGRGGLLDWQVIHRGPGIREVSYFCTHSIPTELRRAHEESLLRLYLETLAEHGVEDPPDFDTAWQAYRFFAFDAWDSVGMCVVWPGLQPAEFVVEGFRRANLTVLDLEVDKAVMGALG
ncbi:ecdysteroid 22-kinase family protein [Mycobacterium bourgelatii]|uniref:Phosphotransferase n=1 Tax=Mycobacterium bourgelatii TaxID=1273442 RepID=A0A7I9YXI9_MYCBU|nr:ecdysteroid 22-kinase family protein [Mycobacterium bourgelatii]GFG93440.1 phosphotransferase [Mycobacterium bourgelatii]